MKYTPYWSFVGPPIKTSHFSSPEPAALSRLRLSRRIAGQWYAAESIIQSRPRAETWHVVKADVYIVESFLSTCRWSREGHRE